MPYVLLEDRLNYWMSIASLSKAIFYEFCFRLYEYLSSALRLGWGCNDGVDGCIESIMYF